MATKSTHHHPSEPVLALYSSGDLDWMDRVRTALHVRACGRCRERVEEYRVDTRMRAEGAKAMPLPANWDSLAEEMAANIRLGIEAAACVREPASKAVPQTLVRQGWYWKPALGIAASMAVLVVALVSSQSEVFSRVWSAAIHGVRETPAVVVESSARGVEVRRGSRSTMRLQVGNSRPEQVSVNLVEGSVRAQYVDDDSLQVTVTNVYAQ